MSTVNWDAVVDETAKKGLELLGDLLEGAKDDLKAFGKAIAKDMVEAVKLGRPDLVEELKDQARMVGEANRIRAVGTTWVFVGQVFATLSGLAVQVATGALSGI